MSDPGSKNFSFHESLHDLDSYLGDPRKCVELPTEPLPQEINIMDIPDREKLSLHTLSPSEEVAILKAKYMEARYQSLIYLRELQLSNRACAKKARYIKRLHEAIRGKFGVADVRNIFKQAKNGS